MSGRTQPIDSIRFTQKGSFVFTKGEVTQTRNKKSETILQPINLKSKPLPNFTTVSGHQKSLQIQYTKQLK